MCLRLRLCVLAHVFVCVSVCLFVSVCVVHLFSSMEQGSQRGEPVTPVLSASIPDKLKLSAYNCFLALAWMFPCIPLGLRRTRAILSCRLRMGGAGLGQARPGPGCVGLEEAEGGRERGVEGGRAGGEHRGPEWFDHMAARSVGGMRPLQNGFLMP